MKLNWQNIPFSPGKFPFFYGWIISATAIIGLLASIPGQTMGVGVFAESLSDAVGVSRLDMSKAYLFGTIAGSLLLPFAGKALDRLGSRLSIVLASLGFAGGLMIVSVLDKLTAQRSAISVLIIMSLSFMLIRFFGQGCLPMVSSVSIGRWFNHYRGRAVAISSVFTSFGFNYSPRVLNQLLSAYGWKQSYVIMACMFGLGMTIVGWLFYRDSPEKCGLLMDGVEPEKIKKKNKTIDTLKDFTRSEAIKTPAFWVLSMATGSHALLATAVVFHTEAIGGEFGLSRGTAYAVYLPMSFFSIGASFLGSILSDRIKFKWIVLAMMAGQIIGLGGLTAFGSTAGRSLMFLGLGVAGGLHSVINIVGMPKFFGRTHLGAISGVNLFISVFLSAVGPYIFSAAQIFTHSYRHILFASIAMPSLILLAALRTENPQTKLAESQ